MYCKLLKFKLMQSNSPSFRMFREFESYKNYKQYCERLRLIMVQHLPRLSAEFKRFFVDVAAAELMGEKGLKLAMEY